MRGTLDSGRSHHYVQISKSFRRENVIQAVLDGVFAQCLSLPPTHTHKHTHKQTNKQTHKQTHKHTQTQTQTHTQHQFFSSAIQNE